MKSRSLKNIRNRFWSFRVKTIIRKLCNKPKHMPHNPVSSTSKITHNMSPRIVKLNTEKLKINTSVVWKHITRNCVVTWEAKISIPVTPVLKNIIIKIALSFLLRFHMKNDQFVKENYLTRGISLKFPHFVRSTWHQMLEPPIKRK